MPVDPTAVIGLSQLLALPAEERMELARLYPVQYAAASGRPAPPASAPLSPDEQAAQQAGLAKLAQVEEQRLAGVTDYAAFERLPVHLQMRLAQEDPDRYRQLRTGLADRLRKPHVSAGPVFNAPMPNVKSRRS